jgi:Ca2+/H+ antiporter, TMEM165/GDT1 family
MHWHLVLLSFALIFPIELPDKTFVAGLVLATKYEPFLVWIGIGLAFGVQCVVAVTAGQAVSYLPEWVVHVVSTAMFLVGAFLLVRAARNADAEEAETEESFRAKTTQDLTGWKVVLTSFLLLFAAEWGDLTQILTINLVAKHGAPVSVFIGSWGALLLVSGLAVVAGRVLLRHMRLAVLHYIAGAVCLAFAAYGVAGLVTT